ncbi:hypothetical protein Xish_00869 [Xenorhabdus ishibashii]|uniref:Uncharacterized protein n=1 Tax=Xenorhabdus ishibashii TaxID=1034471 RepID=A0A2D0KE91_9GAMM|nr:hypothetical protein Xish_00869 [Xenorhabdus ishibashii]
MNYFKLLFVFICSLTIASVSASTNSFEKSTSHNNGYVLIANGGNGGNGNGANNP